MNSISTLLLKVKPFVILVAMVAMCAMTGCKPGDYNISTSVNVRDAAPEEKARADLLFAQADHQRMQTEQDHQRAQIETDILVETAKINQQLSIEQRRSEIETNVVKANTETELTKARGNAEIRAIDTKSTTDAQVSMANASAWSRFVSVASYSLIIIACGIALSIAVIAIGRSAAHAKHQWAMADILLIQAANRDLPPLIMTRSGYLLDTLTGERARISDASGVNQLRTAAMTRLLEASALAHAAVAIGKDNQRRLAGGVQAADALPGISQAIPLVLPVGMERDE